MTDSPKTMQLAPAHWRQLCLLNAEQLHGFLSSIPAQTEAGASALTDELMAAIDHHVAEGRAFLTAWRKSRVPMMAAPEPAKIEQKATNGAAEPKRKKGGWPLGKPRKPRMQKETQQ